MRQARAKRLPTDEDENVIALPADSKYMELADEHGLPILDDKQHRFVLGILQGLTSDKAWLQAGYAKGKLGPWAIHQRAIRLRRSAGVVAWINAARMADCEQQNYTLSQHIAELDEIKQAALAMGVPGAAVQCAVSKGKALGYYEDRLRVTAEADATEVINQLREAMGDEVANAFAARLLGAKE